MTEMSEQFKVSKTVISEDMAIIDKAFREEGVGTLKIGRGRSGGAAMKPGFSGNDRSSFLGKVAAVLSSNDRILPGMLIHYSDILFNPAFARPLGYALASDFAGKEPDVVMTSEVKGIPLAIFTAHALGVPMACLLYTSFSPGDAARRGAAGAVILDLCSSRSFQLPEIADVLEGTGLRQNEVEKALEALRSQGQIFFAGSGFIVSREVLEGLIGILEGFKDDITVASRCV